MRPREQGFALQAMAWQSRSKVTSMAVTKDFSNLLVLPSLKLQFDRFYGCGRILSRPD
jgi:hypothetical protein